jgi:hypothetical protein
MRDKKRAVDAVHEPINTERDRSPFFVVGAERSGTTMFRLMLDHHPQIACPHEFDFAVALVSDTGEWPQADIYADFLETNGSFQRSGLAVDPALSYPELMESFARQRQGEKLVIGMCVHHHFDRLLFLWPQARFIHMLRDPRDVARSCVEMGWVGNAWSGAQVWMDAEQQWDRLRSRLSPERWIEVKYEELVTDPASSLGRVCQFLGRPFNEQMLSYPESTSYGPPDPSLACRWKKDGHARENSILGPRVGLLLHERGYPASGASRRSVGPVLRAWLRLHNRLRRFWLRIKRIGLTLAVADAVARGAGPKRCNRPMNPIW